MAVEEGPCRGARQRRARQVGAGALLLAILGLLCAGCGSTRNKEAPAAESRTRALDRADAAFLAGNWSGAAAEYRSVLAEGHAGPWSATAHYRLGLCLLKAGQPGPALEQLREAERDDPDPTLAGQVQVALGDASAATGDYSAAAGYYARALEQHGDRIRRDHVLFHLARCEQRTGDAARARAHWLEVATAYPTSPYAAQARAAVTGGSAPAAAPGPSASAGYTAQAGVFRESAGAQACARQVEQAGFRPEIRATVKDGRALYAVTVGRFATWGEANALAGKLRARGIPAIVAP